MMIKYCLLSLLIFQVVTAQNNRYKRQGVKGEKIQQQQEREYEPEPQRPQRRQPTSSVAAGQRQRPAEDEESYNSGEAAPEPPIYGGVMGVPGQDFPAYAQIPRTSFRCGDVPYQPGMYADEETQCQAYHVCFGGRKESFLCGIGTVFNQAILSCDYWHSVDCASSSKYYSANEELGKAGAEPGPGGQAAVKPAISTRPAVAQRPAAQRPAVQRPAVQKPLPVQRPQTRPEIREPEAQEPDYEIEPEREISRPAPRPQPRPAPKPQPRPVAPRPSKTFVPQPQPQPRPVIQPRPVPQPRPISKTSPASKVSPVVRPQPRPIVQAQLQDDEGSDQDEYETTY